MKDRFGRELYEIVCCDCGKHDFIPLKPKTNGKYFCKDCWWKLKTQGMEK